MKQYHIIVSGIVQGVGFRYFTLLTAKDYDIHGWVRNLVNGDVEIVAQGTEEALDHFLGKIRIGPKYSRINHVEVNTQVATEYKNFTIK
ncbi:MULTISPECIES: acylphosphatase [Bacillaceae]|uniref:acylphosphatase n=1 Tax=Bacillaceae TaxID=186817 RepID=UPI00080AE37C|nr:MULTISPECIES: acylphosphatase [Bacillaceae]OCA89422.1 hypothetical protein A8L44_00235 [Bacillus sp. FJAT-27986]